MRCNELRAIICILCLGLTDVAVMADHPSPLPWSFTTPNFDYDIFFDAGDPYNCSNDPGDDDNSHYFPLNQMFNMADALDRDGNSVPGSPAGYHVGYTNLGFKAPSFTADDDEILVYDCEPGGVHDDADCDNGRANFARIILPATVYCSSSERNLRRVTGHELWHHIEYAYGITSGAWGKTFMEGTARMMEDQIYSDIDGDAGLSFDNEAQDYMDNPNRNWWATEYESALGWKHMLEQFGTVATEPQIGVDFMLQLIENIEDRIDEPNLPAVVQDTIQQFEPDMTVRRWFNDFAIANIASEFDLSAIPDNDRYQYIDDADGNSTDTGTVARAFEDQVTGEIEALWATDRWGASYFDATFGTGCLPGWFVGYRATNADDMWHALLAVDENGEAVRLLQGRGDEFAAAFVQPAPPDARYTRMLGVTMGSDEPAAFKFAFACLPGDLDIRLPDSTYKAFVGPPEQPRRLLIRMLISGPDVLGQPTVLGLQPDDFTVYVGTDGEPLDRARIVTGEYVLGEYWLTVRPPTKTDGNTYDLHVSMDGGIATLNDSHTNAVSYETRILDQVLVVDRSGSMSFPEGLPKIDAAKNAASLFADIAIEDDKIGLVSFSGDGVEPNDDATLDEMLDDATEGHRDDVKDAVALLEADGGTSIGDGIDLGAGEFPLNGSAEGEDWLILLSDGVENEAQFWAQVENSVINAGVRISTVALGEDADQVLLQGIANATGGDYYYVDSGSFGRAAVKNDEEGLPNALADAFAAAAESIHDHDRLWEQDGTLANGEQQLSLITVVGDGIVNASFMVNWTDADDALTVTLRRPDNSLVVDGVDGAQVYSAGTHVVIQVPALEAGTWRLRLEATAGSPRYLAILSGDDVQGADLEVRFAQYHQEPLIEFYGGVYLRGLEQPINARLIDSEGIIAGAELRAIIQHPDDELIELPLLDDGEHGDGFGGDGIYGNRYTRTTAFSETPATGFPANPARGSYNVVVEATGTDNSGAGFTRIWKGSFQVYETDQISTLPPSDSDGDGMPNRYEDLHECLDASTADALEDAEDDGLLNGREWDAGTNPCHPDTDGGGEADISELLRSANPFDPADDLVPRIIDAEVIDYISEHLPFPAPEDLLPNANLIRYSVDPSYGEVLVRRSLSPNGPFAQVASFDAQAQAGLYYDKGLTNGVTYYYRLQPEDQSGNQAASSHVFSGTPSATPIPPIGDIVINDGASSTTSTFVEITMNASSDTVEMRLANESTFAGAGWQPYFSSSFWLLEPDPDSGVGIVYAQFRDGDGNESPTVYQDGIHVVSPADVGIVLGQAFLAGAADHSGILVQPPGPGPVAPKFSAPGGVYEFTGLEPGTYDFLFEYPGYESELVENIVVTAGNVAVMPDVTLGASDADEDGVPDVDDNCTLVANPAQVDSNSDGFGNACDPDLDDNGVVNFVDLGLLKQVFFGADPDADFDSNGVVNFIDLGVMKQFFFQPPGPAGVVPGP